mmetsp:Transcript_3419/g.5307  ORF Transcript_3419/g.5307 Transcript_3419/m.5307 type:complete len:102 (-) Transcript_3419:604-909(-)
MSFGLIRSWIRACVRACVRERGRKIIFGCETDILYYCIVQMPLVYFAAEIAVKRPRPNFEDITEMLRLLLWKDEGDEDDGDDHDGVHLFFVFPSDFGKAFR